MTALAFDAAKVKPRTYRNPLVDELDARVYLHLRTILPILIPGGRFEGDQYVARNPTRNDRRPGSFKINAEDGRWAEFAAGHEESGRGVVSLYKYIKGIGSLDDAATALDEQLSDLPVASASCSGKRRSRGTPVLPIPDEATQEQLDFLINYLARGLYKHYTSYAYKDEDGNNLYAVARYDEPTREDIPSKTFRPIVYVEHSDGLRRWSSQDLPTPRVMLHLSQLKKQPQKAIVVGEGEETARRLAEIIPECIAVTSAGGASAAFDTDWGPLKGRIVVIWRDNDESGVRYASDVAQLARQAGATSVVVIDLPDDLPEGWDPADPVPPDVDLDVRAVVLAAVASAAQDTANVPSWENPDLSILEVPLQPAPSFPAHLLGPFWEAWALSRARSAAAPVDYTATGLLAVVGAMMGNVRWPNVIAQPGWCEPEVIWAAIVGGTGEHKSPGLRPVWKLMRHAEDFLGEGHEDAVRDYQKEKLAAQCRREKWQQELKAAVDADQPEPEQPRDARDPDEPVKPRLYTNDPTAEKAALMALLHPRGLLLSRDELAGWLAAFERAYGGGKADRAFWLESYNGDPFTQDRVKHAGIQVPHLSVGVLGGIQPDRLMEITGGAKDGLSTRFLYAWPSAYPDLKFARETLDDGPAFAAVTRLVGLQLDIDDRYRPVPRLVPLSPDAEDLLEEVTKDLQRRARAAHGHFAGAVSKAKGHILRLSAILEFLWWSAEPQKGEPSVISLDAVEAAEKLVEGYFLPMAKRVFGDEKRRDCEQNAVALAHHLREHDIRSFNARELYRTMKGALNEAGAMHEACDALAAAHLVRSSSSRAGSTAGRGSSDFEVNPALFRTR